MGTSSGTRVVAWRSSSATGSDRVGSGSNTAWLARGPSWRAALPRATRSAADRCATSAGPGGRLFPRAVRPPFFGVVFVRVAIAVAFRRGLRQSRRVPSAPPAAGERAPRKGCGSACRGRWAACREPRGRCAPRRARRDRSRPEAGAARYAWDAREATGALAVLALNVLFLVIGAAGTLLLQRRRVIQAG